VRKRHELKGCVALQSLWRAHKLRKKFLHTIKSVVVVQSLDRKRTSKKVVSKLRQTRKELESCVKMFSNFAIGWVVRHRLPKEWKDRIAAAGEAVRVRKRHELKGCVALQSLWRAHKLRKKFLHTIKSVVVVQSLDRKRTSKKVVSKLRQTRKELDSCVKIQAHERKLQAEKEWKATRKAIHLIGLRLRMKLARLRMHHTKVQQLLLYKLQIIQGLFVTRLLPDGTVSGAQQKIWCDPAFTQLRISWLPPAKGKAAKTTDKGGKRPDEHPMVLAGIVNVENLKGDALNQVAAAAAASVAAAAAGASPDSSVEQTPKWAGCVVVTHKDGRVFSFGFAEAAVAACVATGLRSNADPAAQHAYVQALIHEHK